MVAVLADAGGELDAAFGAPCAAGGICPGACGDPVLGLAVTAGGADGRAVVPLGERSSTGARPGEVEQAAKNAASAIAKTEGRTQWR